MRALSRLAIAAALVTYVSAGDGSASAQVANAQGAASVLTDDLKARGSELSKFGIDAFSRQKFAEAEQHWMAALAAFEQLGDPVERANTLRNLTFLPRLTVDDRVALLDEALALVRPSGNPHVEGLVRAQIADFDFIRGDYAAAAANLDVAIPLLGQQPRSRIALGRALTSRARLDGQLGRADASLRDLEQAASLLEAVGDWGGTAQSHHGIGLNLLRRQRYKESSDAFARAVSAARRSGNARQLANALMQSAIALQRVGRDDDAVAQLGEAEALVPMEDRPYLDGSWGQLLVALGRPQEALHRLDRALAEGDRASNESRVAWLTNRARAFDQLGRTADALASSTSAVALIENVRARLVPDDEAKRGYADMRRSLMADHVFRHFAAGRPDDALEAAERARARAFLDLLATTDLRASMPFEAPAKTEDPPRQSEQFAPRPPAPSGPAPLDALVATRRAAAPRPLARPEPSIASVASVDPPTLGSIVTQAARLESHIVSYWVAKDRTFIWVVSPGGRVTSATSSVGESRLSALVQRTFAEVGGGARGETMSTAPRQPLRAADRLTFGADAAPAYRELYRALVAPIQSDLPPGALVTIVPHGPLFRLAFAALIAPSGKYLVEDFTIHYAPSASTLAFTSRRPPHATTSAVIVADPAIDPALGGDKPLARLPGAAREGQTIAEIFGAGRARLLQGADATETGLREAASSARVLHFATHGIVRDDYPFESFLALAGRADAPAADGRLTMAEIYGLRLNADLVVLSACRSAAGPVTGDGIIGLTRGFFSAGAPSVIASLWDVPDSVSASVFPAFYKEWTGARSKASALRASQLAMIRDLRAGRVGVDTPAGRFVLSEHPALWAGLILVGEP